jgi:hypothetical protein
MWNLINQEIKINKIIKRPYESIVVMPKMQHVKDFKKILFGKNKNTVFVLHPREALQQKDFLLLSGFVDDNFIYGVDILRISNETTVFDYGTSISLYSVAIGANLIFNNLTNKRLIIDIESREKVLSLLKANNDDYMKFISSLLPNSDKFNNTRVDE